MNSSKAVKILVVYDSYTGNTEKMARAVAKGASSMSADVTLKKVGGVTAADFIINDGFAFGTPTHCGVMSTEMNRLFNDVAMPAWGKVKGKVGAAFSSSAGLGGGNETAALSLLLMMINYGMLVFGLPDYAAPCVTAHYGSVSVGKPGASELKACRLLGKRLVELTSMITKGNRVGHLIRSI
jgi:NAD(P)H dehydrogenase (quinone)